MAVSRANLKELKKTMEAKVKINRYAKFEAALTYSAKKLGWGEVVAEFKFHPIRKWRADFGIPSAKLLIEVEGGFWMKGADGQGGRHGRGGGSEKDMEKYNTANIMGYSLLRFSPKQANNLLAVGVVGDWFDSKRDRIDQQIEYIHEQADMKKEDY